MSTAVDPDDVDTWPAELRDCLSAYVRNLDPTNTYAGDIGVGLSDEAVSALLGGRPLRTYHATRLLPNEAESVRRDGLRALNADHVERRIDEAVAVGAIRTDEADRFRAQTVYATGFKGVRSEHVCLILGLTAFAKDWRGVWPLLSTWGGEGIYMHADQVTRKRLGLIGTPSIVVVDLPLASAPWLMFPGLGKGLAGHLGGFLSPGADVHYKASVPASAIASVWQPGSPEYDRFADLPRA